MKHLFLILTTLFLSSCSSDSNESNPEIVQPPESNPETVQDIDGNTYHNVTIGTQTWMVENLRTTHFRNGEEIPMLVFESWNNPSTAAYYSVSEATYVTTYGRLYNWYAVKDSRLLAPTGWHIPSKNEWEILADYLGGHDSGDGAGGKMKETGTTHWLSPNTGADNSSGFTGLPGGFSTDAGGASDLGYAALWWTTTERNSISPYACYLTSNSADVIPSYYGTTKDQGYAVRCVKD